MSQSNFPRFRPALESLDVRAMPAPLLMQVCASGVPASADVGQTLDLKATSSGESANGTQVGDRDGNVWWCYETDKECVCDPY
jgi:hypothetical protein